MSMVLRVWVIQKVVVNYNYFLVPVLKDVAKKHPAIACKFIYLE